MKLPYCIFYLFIVYMLIVRILWYQRRLIASIFFMSSFGEDVILRSSTAFIRLIRESTMLENIACLASTLSTKTRVNSSICYNSLWNWSRFYSYNLLCWCYLLHQIHFQDACSLGVAVSFVLQWYFCLIHLLQVVEFWQFEHHQKMPSSDLEISMYTFVKIC